MIDFCILSAQKLSMNITIKNMGLPFQPKPLLVFCRKSLPQILQCIQAAVEIESPSSSSEAVGRLADFFAGEFRAAGGQVKILRHRTAGPALVANFSSARPGRKPLLVIGHLDTVWDFGTLREMPFRIRGNKAYGPGIFDMKAGIVCGLWALRSLHACGIPLPRPVHFFLNPDEEVSSVAFRKQLLAEGVAAEAALVLEPAAPGGAVKTARKGVGEFRLAVHGRSAHAGINPSAGVNAISELCGQLRRIEGFARPGHGLTLNVGVIQGGTRSNVVPETALATIDVRIARAADKASIERKVLGLRAIHPEARVEVRGGINRPPLERRMAAGLYRQARQLAAAMGIELPEAASGGGSDGNFTASLGTPTLDGLGAVGEGAHARHEHVLISELPRRTALIAALLATL
jgi:glutamate carboxypeptidase